MPESGLIAGILSTGGVGIAFAFVLVLAGWLWTKHAVDEIKRERDKAETRAEHAEAQRDEALKIAQEKMLPLLAAFTTATDALLPLLQWQVREREERASEQHPREDRRGRPPR